MWIFPTSTPCSIPAPRAIGGSAVWLLSPPDRRLIAAGKLCVLTLKYWHGDIEYMSSRGVENALAGRRPLGPLETTRFERSSSCQNDAVAAYIDTLLDTDLEHKGHR
jgi:hypothetical protein